MGLGVNSAPACWARSAQFSWPIYVGLQRTLIVGGGLYIIALSCLVLMQKAAPVARPRPSVLAQP